MKVFTLNVQKCTGCRLCELACSFKKHTAFNRELSDIRVESREDLALHVPIRCMQCEDPPCARACLPRALYKDETTGAVLLDGERCILCKACIIACPFGAISLSSKSGALHISLCDLCGGRPECVTLCQSGAISYVDEKSVNRRKRESTFSLVTHPKP
jgi:Fe-S-cluster-containing hydrogenase component 2